MKSLNYSIARMRRSQYKPAESFQSWILRREINEYQMQLKNVTKRVEDAAKRIDDVAKRIDETGERIEKTGQEIRQLMDKMGMTILPEQPQMSRLERYTGLKYNV